MISLIFKQNIIPIIRPKIVPHKPIKNPFIIKILSNCFLPTPKVLRTPISLDLVETKIIIEEIRLKAATKIINKRIKNITFLSTSRALNKVGFNSLQSIIFR